jgi:hypothetical protein
MSKKQLPEKVLLLDDGPLELNAKTGCGDVGITVFVNFVSFIVNVLK